MFLLFNSAAHILMPGVYTQLSPHETCLVGVVSYCHPLHPCVCLIVSVSFSGLYCQIRKHWLCNKLLHCFGWVKAEVCILLFLIFLTLNSC